MRPEYILGVFRRLPLASQVDVLRRALDFMKEDNQRTPTICIGLALGLPEKPRITKIEEIRDYDVVVNFEHGEKRIVHFRKVLDGTSKFHYALLGNLEQFRAVAVVDGTLAWTSLGNRSNGHAVFQPFAIDPGLLFECSCWYG